MAAIFIIGLIVYAIFVLLSKNKPDLPEQNDNDNNLKSEKVLEGELMNNIQKNIEITVADTSSAILDKDDSIIDVTDDPNTINTTTNFKKFIYGVPYWAHHYVYSYYDIYKATPEQQNFYLFFKQSFLKAEYFDLEGNTNYAFILLFDLLNEYEKHGDISKLENQLQNLGQCYPKTKSYGITFLIQKMEAKGDNEGISRLRTLDRPGFQYNNSDYDYWKLGSKYKTKLKLNEEEVLLLNKIWYPTNVFCSVEYCHLEILKLYIAMFAELKSKYIQEGTTFDQQFITVADVITKKQFHFRTGSNQYKYSIETITNEIYSNIFKHCENAVREHYGHKRKLNTDTLYTEPEAKEEFETKIILKVTEILLTLVSKITPPDEKTEIELYAQNTSRWKIKFEELTTNYKDNPKQFIENTVLLGNLNKKNPSIENIFFEASKFISQYDKEAALTLYVHYLYHDLKSAIVDNKQLTKTIQKSLFKTNEQLRDFGIVVSELIKDKNLENAIQGVSKIYAFKRKKIHLDTALIKEAQQQHSETVGLLNEYLKDEFEDEINFIKTQEINDKEIKIEITQKTGAAQNSIYNSNLVFTQIQTTTLEIFVKSNYSVLQNELEVFAKSKSVFKNQLIESINEICYEILDDVLIEEEDEYYTINQDYYHKLLT